MSPHLNIHTLKSNDSFLSLPIFMHVTYNPESYIIILSLFQKYQRIEHKVQNYTVISALSSLLQGVTSTDSFLTDGTSQI